MRAIQSWKLAGVLTLVSIVSSSSAEECNNPELVYQECGTACPLTCQIGKTPDFCIEQCVSGCQCPPEKPVLTEDGKCVKGFQECNATVVIDCVPPLLWQDCGTACPLTCKEGKEPEFCTEQCVSGCQCPPEKPVLTDDGACVESFKNCAPGNKGDLSSKVENNESAQISGSSPAVYTLGGLGGLAIIAGGFFLNRRKQVDSAKSQSTIAIETPESHKVGDAVPQARIVQP